MNLNRYNILRFEIVGAETMNSTIFWDVTPCSLVEVDQHFEQSILLAYSSTLYMGAVHSSEKSINV
jgi:hypothetical protein